jgi:hypothetical protein
MNNIRGTIGTKGTIGTLEQAADWKTLLCRRLRDEAYGMGCGQIDICNVRLMKTRPVKMYAVAVVDCCMYAVTGCNENEMAHCLRVRIAADRETTPKERIYFKGI